MTWLAAPNLATRALAAPVLAAALVLAACGSATPAGGGSTPPEESPVASSTTAPASTSPTPSPAPSPSAPPATGLPDAATVAYRYNDSSVPPQYHRSVELTVTKDEARIVIDSYGDVLADESAPTPPGVWAELGATLPSLEGLTVDEVEGGCTGGTSVHLEVTAGTEVLVDLYPEFCAGANEALDPLINGWIAPARALFPPTGELAPEGE